MEALGPQKLLGSTNCKSENCKKVCGLQIGNPQIAKSIWAANCKICGRSATPHGRYDNPMPKLTSSPHSGYMNSATSMRATRHVSSKTCYLLLMSIGKGRLEFRFGLFRFEAKITKVKRSEKFKAKISEKREVKFYSEIVKHMWNGSKFALFHL